MTVARPDSDSIGSAAQHFGFGIDAADRAKFPSLVDGARCSYVVDELRIIDRANYLTGVGQGRQFGTTRCHFASAAMMMHGMHFGDATSIGIHRVWCHRRGRRLNSAE